MSYIDLKRYKEIKAKAKGGDEKATAIIQHLVKGAPQSDIDRLIDDYYNPKSNPSNPDSPKPSQTDPAGPAVTTEDLSSQLDGELDGIIDENDVSDVSFSDYLKKKKSDANRLKKGPDYFKAFDPNGRAQYLADKKGKYGHKFDVKRKDIERNYRDMDGSINQYSKGLSDGVDDGSKLDMDTASKAYDGLVGNEDAMHGFGRSWDSEDSAEVMEALQALCKQYGRANVIAALNTLKNDNKSYHDFRNSQIDTEVNRYGKSLDKLLK